MSEVNEAGRVEVRRPPGAPAPPYSAARVEVTRLPDGRRERGEGAVEAVAVEAPRVDSELRVPASLVAALPERLRDSQATIAATGGLHATGLFDRAGRLLGAREDVGRQNAMDKVVGWAFRRGLLPLADAILCVSGRLSFELVQKATVAGCPILVAVGAPSSLAVELAADRGITLCGFVRGGRVNVYTEAWRIET